MLKYQTKHYETKRPAGYLLLTTLHCDFIVNLIHPLFQALLFLLSQLQTDNMQLCEIKIQPRYSHYVIQPKKDTLKLNVLIKIAFRKFF